MNYVQIPEDAAAKLLQLLAKIEAKTNEERLEIVAASGGLAVAISNAKPLPKKPGPKPKFYGSEGLAEKIDEECYQKMVSESQGKPGSKPGKRYDPISGRFDR